MCISKDRYQFNRNDSRNAVLWICINKDRYHYQFSRNDRVGLQFFGFSLATTQSVAANSCTCTYHIIFWTFVVCKQSRTASYSIWFRILWQQMATDGNSLVCCGFPIGCNRWVRICLTKLKTWQGFRRWASKKFTHPMRSSLPPPPFFFPFSFFFLSVSLSMKIKTFFKSKEDILRALVSFVVKFKHKRLSGIWNVRPLTV